MRLVCCDLVHRRSHLSPPKTLHREITWLSPSVCVTLTYMFSQTFLLTAKIVLVWIDGTAGKR